MLEDFEEQYERVRDLSIDGVDLLNEVKTNMEEQIEKVNEAKSLLDLAKNEDRINFMEEQVIEGRKILAGTSKYLTSDFSPALKSLQEILIKYSELLQDRLKKEMAVFKKEDIDITSSNSARDISSMQSRIEKDKLLTKLAKEIKELEEQLAQCDQAVADLQELAEQATKNAEQVQKDLEETRRLKEAEEEQRKKEQDEIEEKKKREEVEENEKERLKLEEEDRSKLEEEEKSKEEEEERLKEEEEERKRREEEDKIRMEEEERLRKEEEERRKKEEEERLKREEEEKRRRDPRNWTKMTVFEARDIEDGLGYGIACIVRVPETVELKEEDLTCTILDMAVTRYTLDEHEEVVSNMINIKPSNGTERSFEEDIWLAIPYSQIRNREGKIKIQKPSADSDNDWVEVQSQETTIQDQDPSIRFIQTPILHLPVDGINLIVISRHKRDNQQFNNRGGKLVLSVDHRVSVQVPRNAFRLAADLTIQVIPIDSTALGELKSRYDGCDSIIGSSPIVCLNCNHKPQQPLVISITNPFGGKRKRSTTAAADKNVNKNTNFPRLSTVTEIPVTEDDDGDVVILMIKKEGNGRWRLYQDVSLDIQRDSTLFQIPELAERYLLLRLSNRMEGVALSRIAHNIENVLKERLATIIVRQDVDDNSMMHVECCKTDNINKVIQKLNSDKYTDGPATQAVCLREGDVIEVTFNPAGNVDFDDVTPKRMVFNSNIASSKLLAEIKEKDIFAQNARETFSGHIRLSLVERAYDPPQRFLPKIKNSDPNLMAELLIYLPKLPRDVNKINKALFQIHGPGPLTEDYFNHLAEELTNEWTIVADRLKFTKAAVQRIATNYAHLSKSEAMEKAIKHMLTDWFKMSSKSKNKVEDLRMSLMEAGRNDLAEELAIKNKEYRREIDLKLEESDLQKIIGAYCGSQAAVKSWRKVAKGLGLNENDITAIQGDNTEEVTMEMVGAMLRKWKETNGKFATKENLVVCLNSLKLNEAAGKISLVR